MVCVLCCPQNLNLVCPLHEIVFTNVVFVKHMKYYVIVIYNHAELLKTTNELLLI